MSGMDWVPCHEYGDTQIVPVGAQLDHPLMDPQQATDFDVEGRFDSTPGRYFVHRIVGHITMHFTSVPTGAGVLVDECIWPGIIDDPAIGGVISTGFIDEAAGVNNRLWFIRRRYRPSTTYGADLQSSAQPSFFMFDIRPKQVIDDGQIPLYSIFNHDDTNAINAQIRCRLLLSSLE